MAASSKAPAAVTIGAANITELSKLNPVTLSPRIAEEIVQVS